ncbi:hypothetical protein [Nostoc sp.]|uniref:hypothetical protein n=1 Tax=Nostoc sp. TaxID=1180 RepID=UPI002FF79EFD
MDAEELLRRYAAGERDFSGIDLSSVDLREAELTRISLVGTKSRSQSLTGNAVLEAEPLEKRQSCQEQHFQPEAGNEI